MMELIGNENLYKIGGRHIFDGDILYLSQSASYVGFSFCGKRLDVTFLSDGFFDDNKLSAWAAVFFDNEKEPSLRFELPKGESRVTLTDEKETVKRSVRIMKYSENAFASLGIKSISTDGEFLKVMEEDRPLIEFIGDSITCGYGLDGIFEKDVFETRTENPWEAYACRTAEILHADFSLVSWSGNGVLSHYVDESVNEARHEKPFLQEMYGYSDLELSLRLWPDKEPESWKPLREPDIIVVHAGTNDASFTRGIAERNVLFKKNYRDFLLKIRTMNPDAPIFCVLGIMNPKLNDTLTALVNELKAEGFKKLYVHIFPEHTPEDGYVVDYHPSLKTHQKAAAELGRFILSTEFGQDQ